MSPTEWPASSAPSYRADRTQGRCGVGPSLSTKSSEAHVGTGPLVMKTKMGSREAWGPAAGQDSNLPGLQGDWLWGTCCVLVSWWGYSLSLLPAWVQIKPSHCFSGGLSGNRGFSMEDRLRGQSAFLTGVCRQESRGCSLKVKCSHWAASAAPEPASPGVLAGSPPSAHCQHTSRAGICAGPASARSSACPPRTSSEAVLGAPSWSHGAARHRS